MKTLSYIYENEQEIDVGADLYFGQIWDGYGNGEELLKSRSICLEEDTSGIPVIVAFCITKNEENILDTVVHITDIY